MTSQDWHLVLIVLAFLGNGLGLFYGGRAAYRETKEKGLSLPLQVALVKVYRKVTRKKPQTVSLTASGQFRLGGGVAFGTYRENPADDSVEARLEALETNVKNLLETQTRHRQETAKQFREVVRDVKHRHTELVIRMEEAERATAKIDSRVLDDQVRGLLFVGIGLLASLSAELLR